MLEVRELACRRGDAELFRDLDFQVAAGEALLVRGANGSGKTSLLRILCGLSSPHAGAVYWQGRRVAPLDRELRSSSIYLGHTAPLKDDLTVMENLDFALRLGGDQPGMESQLAALDSVGLFTRRHLRARQLSAGQRRRVGMARMLLADRPVWLLDEPGTALDAKGVKLFEGALETHLRKGGLAVITTHHDLDIDAPWREIVLQ
jgi:heme exporter protein A